MVHDAFVLTAAAPFRLDFTTWALRRREKNRIDLWEAGAYQRVLVLEDTPVKVTASVSPGRMDGLQVTLQSDRPITDSIREDGSRLVTRMFGLDIDLASFYRTAEAEPVLQTLVEKYRGLKPPRYPSIFEALVVCIACQQVSLDLGLLLLNRLAESCGRIFLDDGRPLHAFPGPEDILGLTGLDLKDLGFSAQKARAMRELADRCARRPQELPSLEEASNEAIMTLLVSMHGIGRWSAQVALLRGYGRLNVFPWDDVGAQNNLRQLYQLDKKPDFDQVQNMTLQWQPYAGMAYFHLLLEGLSRKGCL